MDVFQQISVTDGIDILIVSYVIYKLIMLVKGTRAVQLLKGMLIIVVVWVISISFNLNTLKWLMDEMITVGVLAIIVIFQPELRRALEQLGRGKLFQRSSHTDEVKAFQKQVHEIIRAVNYLSRKKTGALIVFERQTGLNDYVETGIPLHASITGELLMNIFIPNTPLHDGAVMIRGNELVAAGCYLPLSENPFISKELGTRHRAAIGMSEVSDAICVVVSEETGQVSLAINGQVVRDIQEESLVSKLYDELTPKSKEKQPFFKKKESNDG
ncbi:diadenylate cyclase CdaA [Longirhabdus pacifica]|uniref:diadenylate cyclase CdaA n=1 Tax=Longirhabdus pacifica TaxID=2305227 RepID=UPI0010090C49|nr:diadenylate cyclase CdaA [Longirhabdus pacifica]